MTNTYAPSITILATGPELTLQDKGRFGFQNIGLSPAGAADPQAFNAIAQQVQQPNPTVLQVMLGGLTFVANSACDIVISGALDSVEINDKTVPVNVKVPLAAQTISLRKNDKVTLPMQQTKRYSYVGFNPALAIPPVLGSTATHIRECVGPNNGKPLQAGTTLPLQGQKSPSQPQQPHVSEYQLNSNLLGNQKATKPSDAITLRFEPSPWFKQHARSFYPQRKSSKAIEHSHQNLSLFCLQNFAVTQQSSAMGYRLAPEVPLRHTEPAQISAGTCLGMIQLPNNGEPIVLLHERQTIGGYPVLGVVIENDIGKLAQCLPGDKVCFQPIT